MSGKDTDVNLYVEGSGEHFTALKWSGTIAGILGALLLALNIPQSGWGYVLFLVSSVCWSSAGISMREPSITTLNSAFSIVNVIGIYSWLL